MRSKKGGWILNTILVLLVLLVLLIGAYFVYINLPGEPESLRAIIEPAELEVGNLSYEVKQFYPNMKFNHNSITYKIDIQCSNEKTNRMLEAFDELETNIGIINFQQVSQNPDIEVSCSDLEKNLIEEDYFIAGEGGAKEIIQTGKYNIITQGVILLHENPKRSKKCEWPNIELHELLHVFGFDHSSDESSLMYPYLEDCNQKLDESIILNLKEIYSKENLADLYFEEVSAVKKRKYLDFDIKIKNSGSIDAKNVVLGVFSDDKNVKEFDLKDISFGAGISLNVSNVELNKINPDKIELVIDFDNLIKELDEDNNVAELQLK
tara:strand:+ start:155 stop:1120 length:966 start_codon:yes stop_codon:yes gene_type:complete